MGRYFFHVDYGQHFADGEGLDLEDLQTARRESVRLLGEMLRDEADGFWAKPDILVTVTDKNNLTLWTLSAFGVEASSASVARPKR